MDDVGMLIEACLDLKKGDKSFVLHGDEGKWRAGVGNPSQWVLLGEIDAEVQSQWHDRPEDALLELNGLLAAQSSLTQ